MLSTYGSDDVLSSVVGSLRAMKSAIGSESRAENIAVCSICALEGEHYEPNTQFFAKCQKRRNHRHASTADHIRNEGIPFVAKGLFMHASSTENCRSRHEIGSENKVE